MADTCRAFGALFAASAVAFAVATAPAHATGCTTPDAVTPDGGRYCGPLVNGRLHGKGRVEWPNGAWYEGEFVDGLLHGRGRMRNAVGELYEGEFRDGLRSGRGRLEMADGSVYVGEFRGNAFHGRGRYEMPGGIVYEGEFVQGHFSGEGDMRYPDGRRYRGGFLAGSYHGRGRFEAPTGEVHEGWFERGEFRGRGVYTRRGGVRYEGGFENWRFHGPGRYVDEHGNVFEGRFEYGELNGEGRFTGANGARYEGGFRRWRFHGQGRLQLPSGDVYAGNFADGSYDGPGTLTFAVAKADGRKELRGRWRRGVFVDEAARLEALRNVEAAIYNQRALLDRAIAGLAPREPGRINMYLLAVGGDGNQDVFRREVDFVRDQFSRRFGLAGRSIVLVNSRSTVTSLPMATVGSVREALRAIASRMDTERDVLFLFLTSHGTERHELTLAQPAMELEGLDARRLGGLIRETRIRWKVIVVSACYSGGFIDHLDDGHTLVITAARRDRTSFGCSDDNDFTYFGRAFFKEALPKSRSFQEAFRTAEALVREWETSDRKKAPARPGEYSLPQMVSTPAIEKHLEQWWREVEPDRTATR